MALTFVAWLQKSRHPPLPPSAAVFRLKGEISVLILIGMFYIAQMRGDDIG